METRGQEEMIYVEDNRYEQAGGHPAQWGERLLRVNDVNADSFSEAGVVTGVSATELTLGGGWVVDAMGKYEFTTMLTSRVCAGSEGAAGVNRHDGSGAARVQPGADGR